MVSGILAVGVLLSGMLYFLSFYANRLPKGLFPVIEAVLVLIFGIIAIRLLQNGLFRLLHSRISEDKAGFLKFILNFIAYFTLFLFILSALGIDITKILLGATFFGVIFGIASQALLSNLFAGFVIFLASPFRIGDRITIVTWQWGLLMSTYQHEAVKPGYTGIIRDINILFTTIEEDNGLLIKAPNNILMQALITNYSEVNKRTVRVRFELDKSIDFENFRDGLTQYLLNSDLIEKFPAPSIKIVDLSLTSYFVAVVVYAGSIDEDPVRDLVLSYVLKRQAQVLNKPLLK